MDDDSSTLNILSLILKNAGYEVQVDDCGGLPFLQSGNFPDLILLDSNLGEKDGATLCRQLKSSENTRHIPVIIISAMQDIKSIFDESGADNYLSKPFGINQLLGLVEHTLDAGITN